MPRQRGKVGERVRAKQRADAHRLRKTAVRKESQLISKKPTPTTTLQHWGYKDDHHLIIEKVPPPSLVKLRELLQEPQHSDIKRIAEKQPSFETCLGAIAACLDIVLDGEYDAPDLCDLLARALLARGTLGNAPHKLDDRLTSVELVERENTLELVEADGTIAPQPLDAHSIFMRERGCTVCENRRACVAAGVCLGSDALEAGSGKEGS